MGLLNVLDIVVLVVHVLVCIVLIGIVLIQGGKGASLSASFGLGGSSSAFGAQSDTMMVRWTRNIAITFLITAILLTYFGKSTGSLVQRYAPAEGISEEAVPSQTEAIQPNVVEEVAPAEEPVSEAAPAAPEL